MSAFAPGEPGLWPLGPLITSGALHDVRNVLAVIAGHADLLLQHLRDADPLRRNVDAIRKAADSASSMMQHMLDAARSGAPDTDLVNMNAIVERVVAIVESTLPRGVVVETRLDPRLGAVRGHRTQLEQVVLNLVVNARDAMPHGGRLIIETANVELGTDTLRRAADLEPGRYVMLAVCDTGSGIEPAVQGRLFEPYVSTKSATAHHGLGLATAKLVVTGHGGVITVASAAGEGSIFRVHLPRAPEPDDREAGGGGGEPNARGETILVTDDETEVRELMREVLELQGYAVLEASDTDDALRLARRHPGPIHLVIADLSLAGMSIVDFRRALADLRPDARVLYASGHSRDEIIRRVGGVPGPVLEKPFAVGALAAKVREVLDS